MTTVTRPDPRPDTRPDARPDTGQLGRRRLFTIGGASIAAAALIAACADDPRTGIARVGTAPTTTKLPDAIVTDAVLLRTAASIERSAIGVYNTVVGHSDLLDPKFDDIVKRFIDDHTGHAALLDKLTTATGGTPFSCGNPRFDSSVLQPILRNITGAEKTDLLPKAEPSDNPKRDVLNLAHALESLAGAMYQGLVAQLNDPALRQQVISIGTHEVRHAAVLAIAITGRPAGYVNPSDVQAATLQTTTTAAATTTTQDLASPATTAGSSSAPAGTPIPKVYAIPAQFGLLGQIQLVVGKPNENGTRLTTNLETPSLNTYTYDFTTCATK
jgi:rubrerythrin